MHSREEEKALSQMNRHPSRTPSPVWLTKSLPWDICPEATKQTLHMPGCRARRYFFKWSQFRLSTALASWTAPNCLLGNRNLCPGGQTGQASTVSLTYRQQQWQILTNMALEGNMAGLGGRKRGWFRPLKEEVHRNNLPKDWWSPHHSSLEVFKMLLGTRSSHLGSLSHERLEQMIFECPFLTELSQDSVYSGPWKTEVFPLSCLKFAKSTATSNSPFWTLWWEGNVRSTWDLHTKNINIWLFSWLL